MSDFTRQIIQMLMLLFTVFAVERNYGQCSLTISNYSDNVARATQITVSGNAATAYTWQFGDGSADTVTGVPQVAHLYTDTGTYTVCVYGFDSNTLCRDTICQTLALLCSISGDLTSSSDTTGIARFTANLQTVGSVTGYYWLVTDQSGDTIYSNSSLFDTLNLSLAPGIYFASVVATTASGCSDTLADTISMGMPDRCTLLQQGVPQSKNTYVRSDIPNINFGLSPDFLAERWQYLSTGYAEARGLMIFDLSSIPAGSTVTSASLSLYADSTTANSGNGYPGAPTYGQNDSGQLQRITAPWNQLEVTWNTQPATIPQNLVSLPRSTSLAQNYMVDVTEFLKFWIQHPDSNFGMMLNLPTNLSYNNLVFCSSAHPDSALRPALNICYQAPLNACNANFTYSNTGDSVWFYNQSIGADSVLWRFDDGDSSSLNNPVHAFSLNGIHPTTLEVFDSTGSCSSVTSVNVTGIVDDTICGVVFFDVNSDHLYDNNDYALSNFEVVIDGISYYTDTAGFYHVPVGGGGHIISAVIQSLPYTQIYPLAPLSYTIATTNSDYICGLDFGMYYGGSTGIKPITDGSTGSLFVFPNPVRDMNFKVVMPASFQTGDVVLSLVDVLGSEVAFSHIETQGRIYNFNLPDNISPGLYILRCTGGGAQLSGRIMVIR